MSDSDRVAGVQNQQNLINSIYNSEGMNPDTLLSQNKKIRDAKKARDNQKPGMTDAQYKAAGQLAMAGGQAGGMVGGAVSGAASGAALGSLAGPVGTAVGAAGGFMVGAIQGRKQEEEAASAQRKQEELAEQQRRRDSVESLIGITKGLRL